MIWVLGNDKMLFWDISKWLFIWNSTRWSMETFLDLIFRMFSVVPLCCSLKARKLDIETFETALNSSESVRAGFDAIIPALDSITTGLKTFRRDPKFWLPIRSTNRTTPYLGHESWISCQNRGDLCRKSQRNIWKFAHPEKEFNRPEILKILQNWWKSEFQNSAFSANFWHRPGRKFRRISRKQ